jgi:rRNA maturation endonuclease Nob1
MTFLVAGMFGLGGPELAALAMTGLAVTAVVLMVRGFQAGLRPRAGYSRHCGKCGHGLTQQPDAPFCAYCGQNLD